MKTVLALAVLLLVTLSSHAQPPAATHHYEFANGNCAKIQAFDNVTLLKMWCETTAATIFPKRKIGQLKNGYEANFLVLTGNLLVDFANVKTIELRIKQGEPLP